jgi:nucleoside-diphosphate-sugar epimerase
VILGPGSFMDNIGLDFFPVRRGKLRGFVDADAKVPLVACRDIGRAAVAVLENFDTQLGRRINLMSGLYSGLDICATLSALRGGEKFSYKAPPRLLMRIFAPEFYKMRQAFEQMGRPPFPPLYDETLRDTTALIGQPTTLEEFLRSKGYADKVLR